MKKQFLFSIAIAASFMAASADSFHVFLKDGRIVEYTTEIVDSVVFTKSGETITAPEIEIVPTTPTEPQTPTDAGEVSHQGDVKIITVGGWFESGFMTWQPVSGAARYDVAINKTGSSDDYKKIDTQLIRSYGSYMRADVLGLAAGQYSIMVTAYDSNGKEITSPTIAEFAVQRHDRTGFAFDGGAEPGAYNMDGTLKADAIVLYLTEKSKDKVTASIITSSKGTETTASGIQNILTLYKKGFDARPLDIRVIGQVTDPEVLTSGDLLVDLGATKQVSKGITIEGVGEDATCDGWGIRIKNSSLVEVRNLGTMNCNSDEGDNIGLQQECYYTWVHNCDFFYGDAGSDADQVKGDGALDCKRSSYVTFSYNHFWDNGKCNLLGLKEGTTEGLYITYHHNWYDHSDSRHPRIRYYSAHVYNNYYDGNAKYGVGSTLGSSVFVEANYFRSCKYPIMTSLQGSDVYGQGLKRDEGNNATFSGEAGGSVKAFGNYMTGNCTYIPYGAAKIVLKGAEQNASDRNIDTKVEFDFYEVSSKSDKMPSSVTSYSGSNTYNNFDTSSSMYSYTADKPADAMAKVKAYAGRINGGDFKWTFTEEDDASYAVNTQLKASLTNYKTTLQSIQGE